MEAYIINVLLSWFPWLMGVIAITLTLFFVKDYLGIPPFKTGVVLFCFSFLFSSLQSGNTYKNRVVKSATPSLQRDGAGIKTTPPLIEQGKKERKERFDDLTNWKGRVE